MEQAEIRKKMETVVQYTNTTRIYKLSSTIPWTTHINNQHTFYNLILRTYKRFYIYGREINIRRTQTYTNDRESGRSKT